MSYKHNKPYILINDCIDICCQTCISAYLENRNDQKNFEIKNIKTNQWQCLDITLLLKMSLKIVLRLLCLPWIMGSDNTTTGLEIGSGIAYFSMDIELQDNRTREMKFLESWWWL